MVVFVHNDRLIVLGFLIHAVPQHPVAQTELVDVPNAVDEIVIVFSGLLLRTLVISLLRSGPFVPYEVQEVLLHVVASVVYDKTGLAPFVVDLERLVNGVIARLRIALLR